MKSLRLLSLLAACCATSTVLPSANAAEPAPAKPAPAAEAKPASESAAPKDDEQTQVQQGTKSEEAEAAEEQLPPAPKSKPGKGGSPERFVPSEQVRADFDVSFPIDI